MIGWCVRFYGEGGLPDGDRDGGAGAGPDVMESVNEGIFFKKN